MITSLDMDDVEARSDQAIKDLMDAFDKNWNGSVKDAAMMQVLQKVFGGKLPKEITDYLSDGGKQNGKSGIREYTQRAERPQTWRGASTMGDNRPADHPERQPKHE